MKRKEDHIERIHYFLLSDPGKDGGLKFADPHLS